MTIKDEFREGGEDYPVAFRFETPGDWIVGEIIRFSQGYDPDYREDAYPILVLEAQELHQDDPQDDVIEAGDEASVHVFHDTLMRELFRWNPKPGETVGIKRMADRDSKRGRTYRTYHVVIEGREQAESFTSAVKRTRAGREFERMQKREKAEREAFQEEGQDDLPF